MKAKVSSPRFGRIAPSFHDLQIFCKFVFVSLLCSLHPKNVTIENYLVMQNCDLLVLPSLAPCVYIVVLVAPVS